VPRSLEHEAIIGAVADLLKAERKNLVQHVERRVTLLETKLTGSSEEVRAVNLHRRLTKLESEVRRLMRDRGER
jgi:hypothetical protein